MTNHPGADQAPLTRPSTPGVQASRGVCPHRATCSHAHPLSLPRPLLGAVCPAAHLVCSLGASHWGPAPSEPRGRSSGGRLPAGCPGSGGCGQRCQGPEGPSVRNFWAPTHTCTYQSQDWPLKAGSAGQIHAMRGCPIAHLATSNSSEEKGMEQALTEKPVLSP